MTPHTTTDSEFFAQVERAVTAFIATLNAWAERKIDPRNPGGAAFANRLEDAVTNLEPLLMIMKPCKAKAAFLESDAGKDTPMAQAVEPEPPSMVAVYESEAPPKAVDGCDLVLQKLDECLEILAQLPAIFAVDEGTDLDRRAAVTCIRVFKANLAARFQKAA